MPYSTINRLPKQFLVIGMISLISFLKVSCLLAEEDVKINILAMNPSETTALTTSINQPLPPEVKPEDIVEAANLQVKYDQEKGAYYLTGEVTLNPKETKTIPVKVKNVWLISDEELAEARADLAENVKNLQGTDFQETAQLLEQKVSEKLAQIEEERTKAVGMRQRIELYRAHVQELNTIKREISSVQSLKRLKAEQAEGVRTAKFVITAENPSPEVRTMTVRAELPKDITGMDVLDKAGFLLLYDDAGKRFSVEKEDKLEGKEKKKYEIILRDIWYIPQSELDYLRKQTETILEHLTGSNYEDFAVKQTDFIFENLDAIEALQAEVAGAPALEDKIRAHVLNTSRFTLAKQKLKDLQDLLLEIPMERQETVVDQIRKAVKSLSNIIDIIKLGFKPDLSTTWWIILGLIAFLFIMATSFYVIWVSKLKDTKTVKKKSKDDGKKTAAAGTPAPPNAAAPPK
ncbi:MAG: hypothetical protein COW12_05385 [Candidatus Omnitrophica bacterium CG12_big_fil_rev_8_21_14_0_65_45_16]|nr:MAG: hypothetical protein COW12_05385 [Candidatus Omnitrophica bacterium CG12_big_fil_rev_8_21_14_0_65_45_16]